MFLLNKMSWIRLGKLFYFWFDKELRIVEYIFVETAAMCLDFSICNVCLVECNAEGLM